MNALLLCLAALLPMQDGDQEQVKKLLRDLGSDDFETREKADQALRGMGDEAVPALKEAAEDEDAERAMRARTILKAIEDEKKQKKTLQRPMVPGLRFEFRDWTGGMTFRVKPDGGVELTVPETDPDNGKREFKTYSADSIDDFKKKYPEIAKKYNLDRMLPRVRIEGGEDPSDVLKKWRERFRNDDFDDLFRGFRWRMPGEEEDPFSDLDKWMENQRKLLDELLRRRGGGAPNAPRPPGLWDAVPPRDVLGVRVGPVNETLRSQLGLDEEEGIQVLGVEKGTLAERAGLKQHDIITKLDGRKVEDRWQFREQISKALQSQKFTLEVLRSGKRETLEIEPGK